MSTNLVAPRQNVVRQAAVNMSDHYKRIPQYLEYKPPLEYGRRSLRFWL